MFDGFPPEAPKFFRGLARNNKREWFQPRKQIFDEKVKAPMVALVEAVNAELARFAPDYINDPKKAIYRIYTDTRFNPDKAPYKTHLGAIFPRRGGTKHATPGFYFQVSHEEVGIAGGIYMPEPEQMLAIRTWMADNHENFRKAARPVEKVMGKIHGDPLQRIPKGFDAAHPAADLIKMKRWIFYKELDPDMALSPKLLPELIKRFRLMLPVVEMINTPLVKIRREVISRSEDYF